MESTLKENILYINYAANNEVGRKDLEKFLSQLKLFLHTEASNKDYSYLSCQGKSENLRKKSKEKLLNHPMASKNDYLYLIKNSISREFTVKAYQKLVSHPEVSIKDYLRLKETSLDNNFLNELLFETISAHPKVSTDNLWGFTSRYYPREMSIDARKKILLHPEVSKHDLKLLTWTNQERNSDDEYRINSYACQKLISHPEISIMDYRDLVVEREGVRYTTLWCDLEKKLLNHPDASIKDYKFLAKYAHSDEIRELAKSKIPKPWFKIFF